MEGFRGAPRFLAYPRAFTVQSGSDAVLSCRITGDPRPSILWEKDKTPIEPSGRFHVEAKGDLYSLLVSCATPQDSGLYICKAKNSVGETYAAAALKVEVGEPLQEDGCSGDEVPTFLVAPSSTRVCQGEDAMFTCRVSGQPCPVLEWEKDGRKLSDLFESSHFAVGKEPEDWHFLKLFGTRPPDGGVYVCRARSSSREALAAAVLLVEPQALPEGLPNGSPADGPQLLAERQQRRRQHVARRHTGPDTRVPNGTVSARVPGAKAFTVSAGKHAKFRCYITGKPKPEIIWQKDGEPLVPGRRHLVYEDREGYFILKVLYCKPQDQGLYICTASNTAGQTLSAVQLQVKEHRLRFQVQLMDVEVAEREDAVLECQVPLETIPTAWYLEDRELQPSHKYVMEERGVVRRLTIRDARTDDDGIYLCQMKDKGRSIAEVSVRGVITKRLPRKLDVMEGENAVFCVETREALEGICWSRDGLQLQESPRTVLKSFGRTHLLVLVHVTRQDAGIISFAVGESQTSSQLRVKCVKRDPPSAPVAAEMSLAESNAALLTWCPAPNAHLRPPGRYLLERREVAGGEWVQCLATDLPGRVRVLGDSVPREADYCFRVCAANEHGRSSPVEFPGSVHLARTLCHSTLLAGATGAESGRAPAPAARLERGLQDVRVRDGEDARFCLELSAAVQGTWFLNGTRLGEEEEEEGDAAGGRCSVQRRGTEHSLLIRGARLAESGAQVTFVSGSVRDSATLHVQAPQVSITPVPEAERLREVSTGLPVLLECQVSPPDAPVCWLKDGEAVPLDDVIAVQAEGCVRRLLLRSAGPLDAGVYTCDAGDDAVNFVVTVTELPVRILQPIRPPPVVTVFLGETVTLGCELSRADAPVCWVKEGIRLEAGGSLVLEEEGTHRRLLIPAARAEHSGKYICDAPDDTVTFTVQVLGEQEDGGEPGGGMLGAQTPETPPLLVLGAADPLVKILERDVLPTRRHCQAMEDLVLEVHLSHTHGEVKWYKDGEKLQDTGRVRLEEDGARRSLVVLGTTGRDAGEYLCDTGDDSIVFFVTVEVPEPPVTIVGSTGTVEHRCLVAGEDLVLACELSRPDATVHWLRDGQEVQLDERVQVKARGVLRQLTICGAQPSDSGCYVCDAASDRVVMSVEVSAQPVRIVNKEEAQSPLEVLEGESVTLVARLSPETAVVHWQKDGQTLRSGGRLLVCSEGPARSLTIKQAELGDGGIFLCDAGDDEVYFTLHVKEAPVLFVNKREEREKLLVLEGGSAVLSAVTSSERADVTWLGPQQAVVAGERCELRRDGRVHSLVLCNMAKEDAGIYTCLSPHDQMQFDVSVRELQVKFLRGLSDVRARQGERAVLWCELCKARGDVVWRKDGRALAPGPRRQMMAEGRERSLVLSRVEPEDAGEYCCESNDDRTLAMLTVQGELCPRLGHHPGDSCAVEVVGKLGMAMAGGVVEIITELQNLTVLEGEDATFKCLVSPEDVAVTWQLNGQPVVPGERLLVTRSGLCHSLTLRQCQPGDAGTVMANAEGLVTTARLSVQEAQVLFVQKLQDVVVAEEQGDACLEVEVSHEAAEVQWLKQGVLLQPGSKYQLEESGCRRTLTIRCLGPADRGTYRCESLHDRTQAKLCVEHVETFEKETATFHLELSHPGVPGVWTRDGIRVKPSGTCRISATGCGHSLTLERLALEDSGTVTFTADTLRCSARLIVREPPVTMVRVPRDLGVPETGVASFECELSRPSAEVKWFKDGQELRPGPHCRIYSAGRRRVLQLSRCELADAGTYTCDAGDCRASATLHVQERQVHIVQDLQDAQVQEGDNAVFTCEVSHGDVRGDWLRDGEKIKVSSTVKIRQEGTRHFLLFCGVRPEDAGLICFSAGTATSEASLQVEALPIRIVKPLRDKTVLARHKATLECTVSHARGRVRWLRGDTEIFAGDKYEICNLDCYRTLIIHRVGPEDEDSYTCDAFDDRSTARLLVEGS
ncbi:obscurin-like protein 1 [Limosa lapponica baueri]|uniref:Obscurin-like protein 1 n=1 Tax=Limosa lapponica baueri TaxID=1758121 RepID=A0A2I0UQS3_LIMLA|nr:obscurin-like protein 1 [Limosa lapponica baueri]